MPWCGYYIFVTITGSSPSVVSSTGAPVLLQGAYNISTNPTTQVTTFNFSGRFNDVNVKQVFEIKYINPSGQQVSYPAEFKKIKSLFHNNNTDCGRIQPNQNSITATRGQVVNIPISFDAVKWFTFGESPVYCFGTISNYEFQLPAGWKIGSTTSTGSNWISGSNNVTITTDLCTGNGQVIYIRPLSTCLANPANGQDPVPISVSRPDPSFTITSTTSSIACGSTDPVTFTINNNNSITGISGYTWNLGSANNGWLYNGSPAPQTIPTTSNTLTLVPACGSTPSSISAIVTVTSGSDNCNINTNTFSINVTNPTLSISGNNVVCVSETYSIPNLPCNSTVVWSTSNQPGLVSLSCTNCSSTTVSNTGSGGTEWLTATITSCGVTQTVTKKLRIGAYTTFSNFNTTGPTMWCKNQTSTISVDQTAYPGLSNFVWSYPANWTRITGGTGNNYIVLRAPNSTSPPTYNISVTATNVCGSNSTVSHFAAMSNCTSFSVSPNPVTSNMLTIEEFENNTGKPVAESNIQAIEIIDRMGIVSYRQKINSKNTGSHLSIPIGQLRNDIYSIRIFDGLEWKSYKFIVQH